MTPAEWDDLLPPEYVLPAQFFPERPRCTTAEHHLMFAVLVIALQDYERGEPHLSKSAQRLARRWLLEWFASDDVEPLYAFARICAELRLEPSAVRKRLAGVQMQGRHFRSSRRAA